MFWFLLFLLFIIGKNSLADKDFANSKRQGRHLDCKNDGSYGAACGMDAHIVPLSKEIIDAILTSINQLRNQVAHGGFNGLSPATRMATISWDSELANIAESQVKTCSMEHSSCPSIKMKYKKVGQTVASKSFKGKVPNINDIIKEQIQFWFNEYKHTTMETIVRLKDSRSANNKHYGNFVQLIDDHSNTIGCAILQDNKNEWFRQFMTCNYGYGNIQDKPVFLSGTVSASGCKTGVNPEYTNLCATQENYDEKSVSASRSIYASKESEETTEVVGRLDTNGGNDEKKPSIFDNFLDKIKKIEDKFKDINVVVETYGDGKDNPFGNLLGAVADNAERFESTNVSVGVAGSSHHDLETLNVTKLKTGGKKKKSKQRTRRIKISK